MEDGGGQDRIRPAFAYAIGKVLQVADAAVADAVDIPVIASGGVGNLQHLADGIIEGKAAAVLAASIASSAATSLCG